MLEEIEKQMEKEEGLVNPDSLSLYPSTGGYQSGLLHVNNSSSGTMAVGTIAYSTPPYVYPKYPNMDLNQLKQKLFELEGMVEFMKKKVAEFEGDNTKYKPRTLGKKN